ncbi:hypothetical protein BDV93DRAFT_607930 [Ceratobasidium sp. AG-I]|nr:hypothetical protein BDV93DRAFT_607930 [Ceratobasidium sp. AG-I]
MLHGSTQGRCGCITISSMPDEVLELIASQLVLSFGDVVAFSSTSRRIHATTKFLVAQPLRVEDPLDTDVLEDELSNPALGLVRSMIMDVNFTTSSGQAQSEQLRLLLSRTPRLRYLSLHRPPLDPLDCVPRWEPSRSKTASHPFPLRSSHFHPSAAYLSNVTHLDLGGLSIHPFLLSRFPQLTHLKLSLAERHDAYLPTEALSVIAAGKGCNLVAFEIGLHIGATQKERLDVVRACVTTWPGLHTLNLFSVDQEGRIPSLATYSPRAEEELAKSILELSRELGKAVNLRSLALGIIPCNDEKITSVGSSLDHVAKPIKNPLHLQGPSINSRNGLLSLADSLRVACPMIDAFRCLSPLALRQGKSPYTEFYETICAVWSTGRGEWEMVRGVEHEGRIFGMVASG